MAANVSVINIIILTAPLNSLVCQLLHKSSDIGAVLAVVTLKRTIADYYSVLPRLIQIFVSLLAV